MEIERKFIIDTPPELVYTCKQVKIEQSYLSLNPEVRIRREDNRFFLTCKGEGTLSRHEEEKQITESEYNSYLTTAITYPIIKKRYYVPLQDGYIAELDIFEGYLKGLITVEVEFPTIQDSCEFIPVFWFGREVTDDKNYKNRNLAKLKIEK